MLDFSYYTSRIAPLRSAVSWKKFKEIYEKKFFNFFFKYQKKICELLFLISSAANFGLGPLVWEEIENEQTVLKVQIII
jgi:hypothetical protein